MRFQFDMIEMDKVSDWAVCFHQLGYLYYILYFKVEVPTSESCLQIATIG